MTWIYTPAPRIEQTGRGVVSKVTNASCDCCGAPAWYPAHQRPVAILSRVQDDGHGNRNIWDLDLCTICKDTVMGALRGVAEAHGRELPNERAVQFLDSPAERESDADRLLRYERVLKQIASEDYRGNRPKSASDAWKALHPDE